MQSDPLALQSHAMEMRALLNSKPPSEENNEPEPQSTAIITCPKKMVGRVIGKNGETIKALQNFTGAQIQIDQRIDPTRVSIAGPPKALITANNMVQDIVAGTFKGFAMLRAYASQGNRNSNGFDIMSQQAPVYIKGYGFVPPSQFAGDPSEGFSAGVAAPYAGTFPPAIQSPFPAPGYQAGLPAPMMHQNPYAAMQDPQQAHYNLALAQAQLMQAASAQQGRMPAQIPGMPAGALGMQQPVSAYMPLQGYAMREDPNSLAAQLEAMNIAARPQQDTEALSNSGIANNNGQQPRNPPSSAQARVPNGGPVPSNFL